MAAQWKNCPRCNTPSHIAAAACATCGHAFRTQFAAPPIIARKKQLLPLWAWIAAALTFCVFAAMVVGYIVDHHFRTTGWQRNLAHLRYLPNLKQGMTSKECEGVLGRSIELEPTECSNGPGTCAKFNTYWVDQKGSTFLNLEFNPTGELTDASELYADGKDGICATLTGSDDWWLAEKERFDKEGNSLPPLSEAMRRYTSAE